MPQSKELHKEYMRVHRKRLKGSQNSEVHNKGSQYPAILHALTDPDKRQKLEKIHQSLKNHNVLKEIRYGVGGPDFEMVGELLEVTR